MLIGDEVMLTKSREIIEDEVIMTAANHNLESSNPSANRGTLSYKEKLAANVGFGNNSPSPSTLITSSGLGVTTVPPAGYRCSPATTRVLCWQRQRLAVCVPLFAPSVPILCISSQNRELVTVSAWSRLFLMGRALAVLKPAVEEHRSALLELAGRSQCSAPREKESAGDEHRNSGRDDGNRTTVTNQADITQTVSRPEVTEGYGPWMLAKKKERQRGNSSRYQKNDSRDILRAGLQVRHDGGNTKENQAQSNELGQKSRFSVLSGLEDHEEELEQITEKNSQNDSFVCVPGGSNLRITNESKDKGKKPMAMARPLPRSQMKINTQTHEEGKTKGNDKISETRGNMNESQRAESSGSILRNKSRQAAAEHEHTVVRGTKGGEEIMRYTVFDDNRSTDMNPRTMNNCTFVEHTNDPPSHFCTTDAMEEEVFVDLDDESGFGQEGLPLPS
nr:uncharacterized protein LOC109162703 [Ipomoea batatas]